MVFGLYYQEYDRWRLKTSHLIMNKKSILIIGLFLALPLVAFAQPPDTITQPISVVIFNLLIIAQNILWMVAVTFTIIMFVRAGFQYMSAKGDPTMVKEAHQSVIWGSVGAAVIVLAWSIIVVIRLQLGV